MSGTLELCSECREYKRTCEDNICYDCRYKKLELGQKYGQKWFTERIESLKDICNVLLHEAENDKELDVIMESLTHFKDQAYNQMTEERKSSDYDNRACDIMMADDQFHQDFRVTPR